jgi:prolyl oligopeptidase
MKKSIIITCLISIGLTDTIEAQIQPMQYPVTRKVDTVTNYFGTQIADPYRWLEDDNAPETKDWVAAQNRVTQKYLSQISFRNQVRERLTEIWNYPKESAPFKKGDYYFFYKNDGLQPQAVLYFKKGIKGIPKVFIDPNKLSENGTVALGGLSFSTNNKYVAYTINKAGSDWSYMKVMEVATQRELTDQLDWLKFTGAAWKGNGFYYSRYDAPKKGEELSRQNQFQKIYYHKLGDKQENDQLIFEDKQHPLRYFSAAVTDDERFLIIYSSEGTSGGELHYQDLKLPGSKISLLLKGFDYNPEVVDNVEDKLLVVTDEDAPKYRMVLIDPKKPAKENWKEIIPEKEELLQSVRTGGKYLFATYLKDACSKVLQYDRKGQQIREITLPGIGTVGGFGAEKTDENFYYTFTNFTTPGAIYHYHMATGQSVLYKKAELNISTDGYETKQVFYKSKDGTEVPMFLVYKKGLKLDGSNPTMLYAYGGFNISLSPSFSISRLAFLEKGGIYAQPSLRGGGEYGEEWHKAGMLEKKQNVFDDFIGAAEYLIQEGYTSPQKLAISGGSNGGLLVGAVMTQRPELFRVALPAVGVLDMLRYHKFTVGWGWAVEYGSSDNADDFKYLIKYSPLHNLKEGINYPATLITTADHDDRVVPAHSFKFAATLQEKYKGKEPMLIRIETDAGHGAGKPTAKAIDEATDIWSFVFYNLGLKY